MENHVTKQMMALTEELAYLEDKRRAALDDGSYPELYFGELRDQERCLERELLQAEREEIRHWIKRLNHPDGLAADVVGYACPELPGQKRARLAEIEALLA